MNILKYTKKYFFLIFILFFFINISNIYKVNNSLSEDGYTAGIDDGVAGKSLEEDG